MQPFFDPNATIHQPQGVPPALQLMPGNPTAQQAAVYESFQTNRSAAGGQGAIEQRFNKWLEDLDTFINANPSLAYHTLKDHPTQKALVDDIMNLVETVSDSAQVEKMAATLFVYAPSFSCSFLHVG
jgi:hypothetical protein